jgi:hypothetical protein
MYSSLVSPASKDNQKLPRRFINLRRARMKVWTFSHLIFRKGSIGSRERKRVSRETVSIKNSRFTWTGTTRTETKSFSEN